MTTSIKSWNAQVRSDRQVLLFAGAFFGAGLFAAVEAAVHLNFGFVGSLAIGLLTGSVALLAARVWGGGSVYVVAVVAWLAIAVWDIHGQ
jgi:hypothetical protein